MKQILKPIFEMITGEYILFENIIQNYIAMTIIGIIAFSIAWKTVEKLYQNHIIEGKIIGSIIHWSVRLIVFLIVFYIAIGFLWLTKVFVKYKNIMIMLIGGISVSYIAYRVYKNNKKFRISKIKEKIDNKKTKKVIIVIIETLGIICLFIFLPIIFNWIIEVLKCLKIIPSNYDERLLNSYSTILGGLITLVGVWMTIKYENKAKNEENLIIYKPILEVCGVNEDITCLLREVSLGMSYYSSNSDPDREQKQKKFYEQQRDNIKYRILLQNKGRGETFNTVLDCFELVEISWDKDNTILSGNSGRQYVGEILKDGYFGIDVNLPKYLFMPEKLEGRLWHELRANIIINYSDMFDKMKYQYRIHLIAKVSVEKFEENQPYFYKENLKYAKVRYDAIDLMPSKKIYSKRKGMYINLTEYMKEKNGR